MEKQLVRLCPWSVSERYISNMIYSDQVCNNSHHANSRAENAAPERNERNIITQYLVGRERDSTPWWCALSQQPPCQVELVEHDPVPPPHRLHQRSFLKTQLACN